MGFVFGDGRSLGVCGMGWGQMKHISQTELSVYLLSRADGFHLTHRARDSWGYLFCFLFSCISCTAFFIVAVSSGYVVMIWGG